LICYGDLAAEDEVDGEMGECECSAKRSCCTSQTLYGALMAIDTAFETSEPTWLAIAKQFFHLCL